MEWANALGITGAPFDSWLTLRGLRTLAVRMRQHEANAHALAELLAAHPAVRAVHYPGLASHPDHALARRQQRGFGGMLSFELREAAAVPALLEGLACFTLAESLGGVESLIAHPATMTHASMTAEVRARAGIGPALLRLSVGIKAIEDLATDLRAALRRVVAATSGRWRAAGPVVVPAPERAGPGSARGHRCGGAERTCAVRRHHEPCSPRVRRCRTVLARADGADADAAAGSEQRVRLLVGLGLRSVVVPASTGDGAARVAAAGDDPGLLGGARLPAAGAAAGAVHADPGVRRLP